MRTSVNSSRIRRDQPPTNKLLPDTKSTAQPGPLVWLYFLKVESICTEMESLFACAGD